jgi:hypothetical protein
MASSSSSTDTTDLPTASAAVPTTTTTTTETTQNEEIPKTENETDKKPEKNSEHDSATRSFECNICLDTASDAVISMCGHLFCWPCLHQWLETRPHRQICPVCKVLWYYCAVTGESKKIVFTSGATEKITSGGATMIFGVPTSENNF